MKNVLILVIMGVAGYFGYQYYIGSLQKGSSQSDPYEYVLSLPEECQNKGKRLADAISNFEVTANINAYTKGFRTCLREAGLTESEIDQATKKIRGRR